jgi:hypothetical protein
MKVSATLARNGPEGTSAEYSAGSSVDAYIAVTLAVSGTCWAATSINITGGAGPGASTNLPRRGKKLV